MEGQRGSPLSSVQPKKTNRKRVTKRKDTVPVNGHGSASSHLPSSSSKRRKPANGGFGRGNKAKERVHDLLASLGVERPKEVSSCVKAAILNSFVKLLPTSEDPEGKYGLDQVIATGECFDCDKRLKCTVRDVLYQPDYAGLDYEDGRENATFRCDGEECGGIYVTDICCGSPQFDSGKFHNHCTQCPRFGMCIGDYREQHCDGCGKHYFAGSGGQFDCPSCGESGDAGANGDCSIM